MSLFFGLFLYFGGSLFAQGVALAPPLAAQFLPGPNSFGAINVTPAGQAAANSQLQGIGSAVYAAVQLVGSAAGTTYDQMNALLDNFAIGVCTPGGLCSMVVADLGVSGLPTGVGSSSPGTLDCTTTPVYCAGGSGCYSTNCESPAYSLGTATCATFQNRFSESGESGTCGGIASQGSNCPLTGLLFAGYQTSDLVQVPPATTCGEVDTERDVSLSYFATGSMSPTFYSVAGSVSSATLASAIANSQALYTMLTGGSNCSSSSCVGPAGGAVGAAVANLNTGAPSGCGSGCIATPAGDGVPSGVPASSYIPGVIGQNQGATGSNPGGIIATGIIPFTQGITLPSGGYTVNQTSTTVTAPPAVAPLPGVGISPGQTGPYQNVNTSSDTHVIIDGQAIHVVVDSMPAISLIVSTGMLTVNLGTANFILQNGDTTTVSAPAEFWEAMSTESAGEFASSIASAAGNCLDISTNPVCGFAGALENFAAVVSSVDTSGWQPIWSVTTREFGVYTVDLTVWGFWNIIAIMRAFILLFTAIGCWFYVMS